jgi:hypothetical protein
LEMTGNCEVCGNQYDNCAHAAGIEDVRDRL